MSNTEKLAQRLVHSLGVAGALKACRENMWEGVAAEIATLSGQRLIPIGLASR